MEEAFSNAEKLAAVVEYWAAPKIRQIMPAYGGIISSAIRPVVLAWARKVPDESIPVVVTEVMEKAKAQGVMRVWKVEIDRNDMAELETLLRANLPYIEPPRGYEVKKPKEMSNNKYNAI